MAVVPLARSTDDRDAIRVHGRGSDGLAKLSRAAEWFATARSGYDWGNDRGRAMSVYTLRLGLGLFFLLMGTALFARRWLMPNLDAQFDPLRLNLGAVFALVFGALNVVRW